MPKFSKYVDTPKKGEYVLKTTGGGDFRTNIPPEKRSFKNLPKYSDGKSRVKFQEWLHIKGEGGRNPSDCKKGQPPTPNSYGKSSNGKWYGWSHRAVYGFKAGDEIKGDNLGKKQTTDPDFTIKNDDHAREVAMTFADNVS
jgi:hypothetical protein